MNYIYPPRKGFDSRGRPLKGRNTNKYLISDCGEFHYLIIISGGIEYRFKVDTSTLPTLMTYSWSIVCNKDRYIYALTTISHRTHCRLHRFLTNCPSGMVVDHINGDTLDNRLLNLRICTVSQNCRNSRSVKGKLKGFWKDKNKYVAAIRVGGRLIRLGRFKTNIEAAKTYDEAAIRYFKEFARLNFPQDVGDELL